MSRDTRELCPATSHTPRDTEIAPEQALRARKHAAECRNRARSACPGAEIRLGMPESRPVSLLAGWGTGIGSRRRRALRQAVALR